VVTTIAISVARWMKVGGPGDGVETTKTRDYSRVSRGW
jgi:hypothetical protein